MYDLFKSILVVGALLIANAAHANQVVPPKRHSAGVTFGIVIGDPVVRRAPVLVARNCSPSQAAGVARSYGVRYQAVRLSGNVLTVTGYRKGQRTVIKLSREAGCRML
jgi:hypothetical protein